MAVMPQYSVEINGTWVPMEGVTTTVGNSSGFFASSGAGGSGGNSTWGTVTFESVTTGGGGKAKGETMTKVSVEDIWEVFPEVMPELLKTSYWPSAYDTDEKRKEYDEWADKVARAAKLKRDQKALEELTNKEEN